MAGVITLKFSVLKDGMRSLGLKSPIFIPGPVEPQFGPGRMIYFEGFSVDLDARKQYYLDATVAYRQTTLRVIEYLRRFGYSDYQVYLLLSCAPVQGHIAGIVDVSAFPLGPAGWLPGCLEIPCLRRRTLTPSTRTCDRSPTSAPRSACPSTFSTLTLCPRPPRCRSATWAPARLPARERVRTHRARSGGLPCRLESAARALFLRSRPRYVYSTVSFSS